MPAIRIELFGNLRVIQAGQALNLLHRNRLQSLLAYLALHSGEALPREQLAFTLWPDSSESQARTNLRQLLHHLRRALPPDCDALVLETQTVSWRRDEAHSVDVLDFEAAIAAAAQGRETGDAHAERKQLETAAGIYQDDLLRGCYDEWLKPRRDRLREQLAHALHRLADALSEPAEAIAYANRLLTLDPLREPSYRLLMEVHERNGDRASALRAYHQCMRVLRRELGVNPGE